MTTKRTPIKRQGVTQITERAVELFREMERLRTQCSCLPIDWQNEYWRRDECDACAKWWDVHFQLHTELGLRPWSSWPCVENPRAENPYPRGSVAAQKWRKDPEAVARYRALASAARGKPEPVL